MSDRDTGSRPVCPDHHNPHLQRQRPGPPAEKIEYYETDPTYMHDLPDGSCFLQFGGGCSVYAQAA